MRLDVAGRSDVGMVRSHNDDRYAIRQNIPGGGVLCVLADGMGGHASGDLAATLAVEAVIQGVQSGVELAVAVATGNSEIYRRARAEAIHHGMGTTVTGVIIRDGQAQFVHVGDSRMYLVRDSTARQLTIDHSWVAEEVRAGRMDAAQARNSSHRNLLTRALGLEDPVPTDTGACSIAAGDALLLCSDGVHNLVSDEELVGACMQAASAGAEALVATVRARGAPDNATVVIARFLDDRDQPNRAAVTRPIPDVTTDAAPSDDGADTAAKQFATEEPGVAPPWPRESARRGGFRYVWLALLLLVVVALGTMVYFGVRGVF